MEKQMGKWGAAGVAVLGAVVLTGCECTPPVRESIETRTVYDATRSECAPIKTKKTVTYIRTENVCPALPPVGELTVVRDNCSQTKMVFVKIRPDDRYYNVETRSFERPWPWGPYGMGCDD